MAIQENNSMSRIFLILIPAIILIASCRSTKKIQSAIATRDSVENIVVTKAPGEDTLKLIRDAYQKLQNNTIDYHTFSAKINTDYEGYDGKKYDVNVFVRMYKDSLIWISVNGALGIEGMRVLIDRDSVKIMNKIDKEYQVKSLSFLEEVASLPLDLGLIQDLIIGNPVFFNDSIRAYTHQGDIISLLCEGDQFRNLLSMHDNDHHILYSKLDDSNPLRSRTCYLDYSDYERKDERSFSVNRTITVTEKSKLDIKLRFKQYAFNETLSFPFSVPKNYKRI